MSKKADPALVGAFAVGALALVVIGLVAFGSGRLFERRHRFVSYFQGSVNGLRVGSYVTFQGVPVGEVTAIQAVVDPSTLEFKLPVVYEIRRDGFVVLGDAVARRRLEQSVDEMIEKGLRAQLSIQSLVTGQFIVELGFHPDTPVVFRGNQDEYQEIPSIATPLQELERRIADLLERTKDIPIEEIFDKGLGVLDGVERIVNSPEATETVAGINTLVNSPDTQALPQSLQATLDEVKAALQDARTLIQDVDARVDPLVSSMRAALDKVQPVLAEAEQTLATAREGFAQDSEMSYRITSALHEFEGAMRALRVLADYLEQHPEALIRGKPKHR